VHLHLAPGAAPALSVNADDARSRAQLAHAVQERGLDVAPGDEHELRLRPRGTGGLHQVLALGHEEP
jgi:hypothetical protein